MIGIDAVQASIDAAMNEPLVQAVGWALLHFVWQGALIGAVTAITLRLLRRGAADVRYVIAAVSLSLMATLPVVTGLQAYRAASLDTISSSHQFLPLPSDTDLAAPAVSTTAIQPTAATENLTPATLPDFERWMPLFVLAWMLGVGLLAVRLAGGWLWMQRMKTHGAVPAGSALQAMVTRLSRRLHITRTITLLRSPGVHVPTVIGWLKPTVLLPMSALSGLSPVQVEAILAHELAHIRRHDYLVNLLQTLLETLLFYHPAVWWVSRQIRTEREHCCDDLAVSLCGDPVVYASALADLEDLRGPSSPLVMAASGGVLLNRVRRLLTGPEQHAGRGPAWLAATGAALLLLVIIGGAVGRQSLIADSRPHADDAAEAPIAAGQSAPTPRPGTTAVPATAPAPAAIASPSGDPAPVSVAAAEAVAAPESMPAPATLPSAVNTVSATGTSQSMPAPPAPPAPPSPPSAPSVPEETQVLGKSETSSGNFVWSNNGEKMSIKYEGKFEFDDQDTGIKSISPGGFLHISDNDGHLVEFTADRAGTLSTRYRVNGRDRAFEPEGRQWLSKILPRFIRQSGINAGSRVARFLNNGGVAAVLAEISRIDSSYAKKLYFAELLKQSPVDPAGARRILEQAGREIDSDYELASLLISRIDKLVVDEPTQKAFFDAARTLESDYEMRRVLSAALKRGTVPVSLAGGLLEAAHSLDSDYEAASLLVDFVKQQGIEATRHQFFAALSTVDSAHEKSKVLLSVLRRGEVSDQTLLAVLNAAGTIGSNYETAQVLQAAARAHAITGPARDAYMKVADRLGDYEQTQALAALARSERR